MASQNNNQAIQIDAPTDSPKQLELMSAKQAIDLLSVIYYFGLNPLNNIKVAGMDEMGYKTGRFTVTLWGYDDKLHILYTHKDWELYLDSFAEYTIRKSQDKE